MSDIRSIGGLDHGLGIRGAEGKMRGGTGEVGGEFASLLASGLRDVTRAVSVAEQSSIAGLNGGASVQQVVESVMQAEHKVQLAVSVRDKIVAAYLEISRMQI